MFVDIALAHTGDVVCIKFFEAKITKDDWGVFESCFRKLFNDIKKFSLIFDTTEANIYAPKWIKKFVDLMLELTPETQEHVTQFIAVVNNDIVRKMVKQLVKLNQSEREVIFVKTTQQAMQRVTPIVPR